MAGQVEKILRHCGLLHGTAEGLFSCGKTSEQSGSRPAAKKQIPIGFHKIVDSCRRQGWPLPGMGSKLQRKVTWVEIVVRRW